MELTNQYKMSGLLRAGPAFLLIQIIVQIGLVILADYRRSEVVRGALEPHGQKTEQETVIKQHLFTALNNRRI